MIRIKVESNGVNKVIHRYRSFKHDISNGRILWIRLIKMLEEYHGVLFANQGFGEWPFYTQSFNRPYDARRYIKWKDSQHPNSGPKLLILSGRLRNALTHRTIDSIRFTTSDTLVFGVKGGKSNVNYASAMKWGNPRNNTKPRNFLDVNPLVNRLIGEEVSKYVRDMKRRNGFG